MKIAVTGAMGLFGHGLVEVFGTRHTVVGLTRADMDITKAEEVRATFDKLRPEIVVHPAGIPDIDLCEAEPSRAFLVNFHGTRIVAEAARDVGASMVYISTDAVFDGNKESPYTESDQTKPPTVYGRTKLRGEQVVLGLPAHWIFRVSVLFGPGKANFVDKLLQKVRAGEEAVVASDQLGSATCTVDAARKIMEVVEARRHGLYHLSNQGACTRLELAQEAAKLAGLDSRKMVGKPSDQLGRRGVRLKYAVMEMAALKRAGLELPRPWQEALAEYLRVAVVRKAV
jgi:dTDP-4-dehydrorhamnose reductase